MLPFCIPFIWFFLKSTFAPWQIYIFFIQNSGLNDGFGHFWYAAISKSSSTRICSFPKCTQKSHLFHFLWHVITFPRIFLSNLERFVAPIFWMLSDFIFHHKNSTWIWTKEKTNILAKNSLFSLSFVSIWSENNRDPPPPPNCKSIIILTCDEIRIF